VIFFFHQESKNIYDNINNVSHLNSLKDYPNDKTKN